MRIQSVRCGAHSPPSLSDNLHDDSAGSGSRIKVDQHDLLPSAEHQVSIGQRYRQTGTDDGCADMRVSVVVIPG